MVSRSDSPGRVKKERGFFPPEIEEKKGIQRPTGPGKEDHKKEGEKPFYATDGRKGKTYSPGEGRRKILRGGGPFRDKKKEAALKKEKGCTI